MHVGSGRGRVAESRQRSCARPWGQRDEPQLVGSSLLPPPVRLPRAPRCAAGGGRAPPPSPPTLTLNPTPQGHGYWKQSPTVVAAETHRLLREVEEASAESVVEADAARQARGGGQQSAAPPAACGGSRRAG